MLIKLNLQRFATVRYAITMNYDSNVTSVDDNNGTVFTTSGENKYGFNTNTTYTFTVGMTQGYELDSVTSDEGNISNVSGNSFQFIHSYDTTANITITSKKATSQVSIDLTTLSGWGNVADGEHVIQVVAKADNYRDSEKSTAVTFTKTPPLVTIPAGTYRFNDTPTTNWTTSYITNIAYKSDNVSYTKMYLGTDTLSNKGIGYNWYPSTNGMKGYVANHGWGTHSFEDGAWKSVVANNNLKTITIETDQQVSQEFKTWFTANTTVVGSFTQVPVTLTNPFSSYISFNASNAPFGRISNMDKTKTYSIQLVFDYYKNDITYLTYNGTKWVTNGALIIIKNQTETSVDLYKGLSGGITDSLFKVIALEGTTQASVSDFTGFTGTETMPDYVCLIEGTLVTLADGSTKPIEDITYDDELLVWNFYDGKFDKAKPCWVTKPQIAHEYNLCKFSNSVEIGFVGQGGDIGYHRIYNDELKSFTHTGVKETPIGTHTFAQDGSKPTLIEQHIVNKQVRFYNVGTQKHINIFTNGILTSARISNKYAIKDMRYVGNRLISEQEEKEYINKKLERC